ncbi:uncharacterized protein SCHCODRAFT_02633143 [Schizophyllum commune H4-8]|uniref:uncharacterized protein n=1 Tax=Schizophyllum commune (strain H4-8 / FGSC 9210) TaxID=578458 RepID=UPI002160A88F|nr:uncharacterized protein SCHCODRAFT_02633143 [Schizophyllum commune H4-8]KAI5888936.1 hypothetical protein SCHCODRAFT_02633143 [Schizophyllum commune H4-8]
MGFRALRVSLSVLRSEAKSSLAEANCMTWQSSQHLDGVVPNAALKPLNMASMDTRSLPYRFSRDERSQFPFNRGLSPSTRLSRLRYTYRGCLGVHEVVHYPPLDSHRRPWLMA